jgi:carbamoyltransferase
LLSDDGIVAAIEESKLVRRRTVTGIPREAIHFCLERAGTGWSGVDCVAVANRPVRGWVRHAWMRAKLTPFAPVPSGYYQTKALGELGRELNNARLLHMLGESPNLRVLHLDHQLCHAASAFYASGADRALILTLDEQGDGSSGSVAIGEGTQLRTLESISFPNSPTAGSTRRNGLDWKANLYSKHYFWIFYAARREACRSWLPVISTLEWPDALPSRPSSIEP